MKHYKHRKYKVVTPDNKLTPTGKESLPVDSFYRTSPLIRKHGENDVRSYEINSTTAERSIKKVLLEYPHKPKQKGMTPYQRKIMQEIMDKVFAKLKENGKL